MKIPLNPRPISRSILAMLGCLSIAPATQAAIMNLGQTFSDGSTAPGGNAPWITVTTSNHLTGAVLLEFEATNLIDHEFVCEWVLNLDPALDPNQLVFSSPQQTGLFALPSIQTGINQFKADGDGWFDIQFLFCSANSDSDAIRFSAGDKLSYLVTLAEESPGSLDEGSLYFLSSPGGSSGPFHSAAHIQGTGDSSEGSAWIANVPEPSTTLLGGLGLLALLRRQRDK